MNGNKKVILHIVIDNVFFDKMFPVFDKMERYENRYLYYRYGVDRSELCYIEHVEKIIITDTLQEWGDVVGDPQNDIIYFHGLWRDSIKAVDYIRKEAVVMWWCHGWEIYRNEYGCPPLLPIKVYKPKTRFFLLMHAGSMKSFFSKSMMWYFPRLFEAAQTIRNAFQGKRVICKYKEMISRVDYLFTPLSIEFDELKKRHTYIKAKPYRLGFTAQPWPYEYQKKEGYILFEHSGMSNNNHIDLLSVTKRLHLTGRDIYVPLSYGDNSYVEDYVKKHASFEGAETHFLTEVMPGTDYIQLISNCSHALFGTIRQSGLGNAYIMLRKGVKMFFFEDSMMYKYFKREGYYVFSIEKDLDDESIRTPLTEEMAFYNYNLFYNNIGPVGESYQQQFDKILYSEEKNTNE